MDEINLYNFSKWVRRDYNKVGWLKRVCSSCGRLYCWCILQCGIHELHHQEEFLIFICFLSLILFHFFFWGRGEGEMTLGNFHSYCKKHPFFFFTKSYLKLAKTILLTMKCFLTSLWVLKIPLPFSINLG